jgi:hypothetical protein
MTSLQYRYNLSPNELVMHRVRWVKRFSWYGRGLSNWFNWSGYPAKLHFDVVDSVALLRGGMSYTKPSIIIPQLRHLNPSKPQNAIVFRLSGDLSYEVITGLVWGSWGERIECPNPDVNIGRWPLLECIKLNRTAGSIGFVRWFLNLFNASP